MKRHIILSLVFLTASLFCAYAQDSIFTVSGRMIPAKVLEIGDVDILYKDWDNLDGPDIRMGTAKVSKIVFQNGKVKYFADEGQRGEIIRIVGFEPIEYRGGHYCTRDGRTLGDDLEDYIGVSLYGSEYLKAQRRHTWGVTLTITGAGLFVGGLMMAAFMQDTPGFYVGDLILSVGCLGAGIPLWVKGSRGLQKIADDYNRNYGRSSLGVAQQWSLTVGPTTSGVGLAFRF